MLYGYFISVIMYLLHDSSLLQRHVVQTTCKNMESGGDPIHTALLKLQHAGSRQKDKQSTLSVYL
jgi:hypothetical protein